MQINKVINSDELLIALDGRLDTTTSPDLEAALNDSLDGIVSLIFDFEKLEYISSAGLRVLLSAQKKMNVQGKMVIKNVCNDIKEIFDITGFSDILTVE